jgi:chemotaxis protein CheD
MDGLMRKFLRPGEFYIGRGPVLAETLVGSCVAVCLYNFKERFGVMNHFLTDRPANPADRDIGRYGVTSTRRLVEAVLEVDPELTHYRATIIGGAMVLKTANADGRIGQGNVAAAMEVLHAARIRIAAQEVGGTRGRRIRFNTQTGEIECRFAGDIPGRRPPQ